MHSRAFVRSCRALALAVVALVEVSGARAQPTIDPVPLITPEQVGMPPTGLDVGVALGDGGVLAFRASNSLSGGVWARTSSGIRLTVQGNNFGAARSLSVNGGDVVGFVKSGPPGTGDAFISGAAVPGGTYITIFGSNFGMSSIGPAKLSNSNQFAFLGTSGATGERGVFSVPRDGGNVITIRGLGASAIVDDNDCDDDGHDLFAFRAVNSSGTQGIYATSRFGGNLLTVTGQQFSHVSHASITGSTAVFGGQDGSTNQWGLYAAGPVGGTSVITIVGNNFGASSVADVASNSNGAIALSTTDATGAVNAIFAADLFGSAPAELIGLGDALAGSTVTRLSFDHQGLNSLNQLVFFAELADGRSGVFLASNVPGPGAGALLIGVGAAAMGRRRRSGRAA